jgi:YD repeat-containing protein
VGNRVRAVETLSGTTRVITYTYDPLNRLTGADYSTGEQFGYTYDEVGNRTVMTDATGVTTYTYTDVIACQVIGVDERQAEGKSGQ